MLLLALVLYGAVAASGASRFEGASRPAPLPTAPRPAPSEVRALWVVRTSLTSPGSVRTMVEAAHRAGFNTLLVQVRGRGDALYRSDLEPRSALLAAQAPGFDPLDRVLREAHARGLEVHAWINLYLVAGLGPLPPEPGHVVRDRPDALAVPRELALRLHRMDPADPAYATALRDWAAARRDRVEGVFLSPAHPHTRERLHAVALEMARRYPLDGLHLDYVRYAAPEFDYSAGALAAFRNWMALRVDVRRRGELDRAAAADPFAWTDAFPGAWDDFRREQVTQLVEGIRIDLARLRPGLTLSAAVFADHADAHRSRYQDWGTWLERDLVDVVAPMAYTPDLGRFTEQVAAAVERARGGRRVWAGVGAWQTTFRGTVDRIEVARRLGAGGVSLFSYDWAAASSQGAAGPTFLERVGRAAFGR